MAPIVYDYNVGHNFLVRVNRQVGVLCYCQKYCSLNRVGTEKISQIYLIEQIWQLSKRGLNYNILLSEFNKL